MQCVYLHFNGIEVWGNIFYYMELVFLQSTVNSADIFALVALNHLNITLELTESSITSNFDLKLKN